MNGMRRVVCVFLVVLVACAAIDKIDPVVNYTPDPKCDSLYAHPCKLGPTGAVLVCCHSDRYEECNPWSGRCEANIPVPQCNDPTCMGGMMVKYDGGSSDATK